MNWPPIGAPEWPPPEFAGGYQASDWKTALREFRQAGFTHAAPTAQERSAFFNATRCGDNHEVIGRMLVSPDRLRRYPFAVCNGSDRELLVLWPPYTCGWLSGPASF